MKSDKLGLILVVASLLAIAAIAAIVLGERHEERVATLDRQGVSLVRALAAVPYDSLASESRHRGVMQVIRHGTAQQSFAYISVVDAEGHPVSDLTAEGVLIPPFEPPTEPSDWLGQRQISLANARNPATEFYSPVVEDSQLRGFVRLALGYPRSPIDIANLSYLGAVALPVFLLVPLFYLLIRSETRPLRTASSEISRMLEDESFRTLELTATGELGDFMRRFNGLVGNAKDRIEELEAERHRLIASSKLLTYRKGRVETVLDTLPEAVLILDESGEITFANQKLASLLGVPREVILTRPPEEWINSPEILHLLLERQGRASRTLSETVRFRVDRSAELSIATRTYPLFSPKDPSRTIGTLIIFHDETQEALARKAREEFVADLAHELKGPLNVLSLYSETLSSEAGRDEAHRVEAANVIAEEVDRLSTLITGLLSLTQIENGSIAPDRSLVRIREVAEQAFEEAKALAAGTGIEFKFDAPMEMNPALADKDLLRIALNNLLSNAVKYNRKDGSVTLTIEEREDALQVRIADTGLGISEEDKAKIFDKFYRSSDPEIRQIGGHGMGLALTKKIIELHQGTLTVDTDRAEGTEFIVNFWKDSVAVKQAI